MYHFIPIEKKSDDILKKVLPMCNNNLARCRVWRIHIRKRNSYPSERSHSRIYFYGRKQRRNEQYFMAIYILKIYMVRQKLINTRHFQQRINSKQLLSISDFLNIFSGGVNSVDLTKNWKFERLFLMQRRSITCMLRTIFGIIKYQ